MTRGVPLVADLANAYKDKGLVVLSITAFNSELADFLAEHEAKYSIANVPLGDKSCVYADVDRNGFSYMFLIGRNGKILWRDNYIIKEKEFLKALGKAMLAREVPPLERELDPTLHKAMAEYLDGQFAKARNLAAKVQGKYDGKADALSQKIAEDAAYFSEHVAKLARELLARMKQARDDKQGLAFVEALDALAQGFPKSAEAKEAQIMEKEAGKEKEFASEMKAARAWQSLLEKYPILFPIEPDKASKAFARKLKKFIKDYKDLSPAAEAEKLLAIYGA